MTTPAPTSPAPEQSRMFRLQVGDVVAITHGDMENGPTTNTEGTITGFANDERSYLTVDFKPSEYPQDYEGVPFEGGELTVTEDEVRRVA